MEKVHAGAGGIASISAGASAGSNGGAASITAGATTAGVGGEGSDAAGGATASGSSSGGGLVEPHQSQQVLRLESNGGSASITRISDAAALLSEAETRRKQQDDKFFSTMDYHGIFLSDLMKSDDRPDLLHQSEFHTQQYLTDHRFSDIKAGDYAALNLQFIANREAVAKPNE